MSEHEVRARALASRLAKTWGMPFGDADTKSAYIDVIRDEDRSLVVRSCGYLPQIAGTPKEVADKLSLIVDAAEATLSVVRAGRFDIASSGVGGGYTVRPKAEKLPAGVAIITPKKKEDCRCGHNVNAPDCKIDGCEGHALGCPLRGK